MLQTKTAPQRRIIGKHTSCSCNVTSIAKYFYLFALGLASCAPSGTKRCFPTTTFWIEVRIEKAGVAMLLSRITVNLP